MELRSYTGLAWEGEAAKMQAEARVAAIETDLVPIESQRTVVLEHTVRPTQAVERPALPASTMDASEPDAVIEIELPEPGSSPERNEITIARPWEQRRRQRSALG